MDGSEWYTFGSHSWGFRGRTHVIIWDHTDWSDSHIDMHYAAFIAGNAQSGYSVVNSNPGPLYW